MLKTRLITLTLCIVPLVAVAALLAAGDEVPAEVEAVAKTVGSYKNNLAKEKKTVIYHDIEYTIYPLRRGRRELGAAVITVANGYEGPIRTVVAFNTKGEVCGYRVLLQTETPRWGDVVPDWFQKNGQGNIIGKNLSEGDLKVRQDNGTIDGITRSTITSRAFLHSVNNAYKVYKGQEPEIQPANPPRHGHGGGPRRF